MLLAQKFKSLKNRFFLLYMYFNGVADKTLCHVLPLPISLNVHEEEKET